MARSSATKLLAAALGGAVMLGVVEADPLLAADDDDTVHLPGVTRSAVAVDFDGDGSRDLVRLVDGDGATPRTVELVAFVAGEWSSIASAVVTDPILNAPPQRGAALLEVTVDRRPTVVMVTATPPIGGVAGDLCCVALHEVHRSGSSLELRPVDAPALAAEMIAPVDFDGDGTDELVVATTFRLAHDEDGNNDVATEIVVLRRSAAGWSAEFSMTDDGEGYSWVAGETDGRPGEELLISVPGRTNGLVRVAATRGAFVREEAALPTSADGETWVAGVADGGIVVGGPTDTHVLEWPAGRDAEVIATHRDQAYPWIVTVSTGEESVILVHGTDDPFGGEVWTDVFDARLRPLGRVSMNPDTADVVQALATAAESVNLRSSERRLWPYIGPLPGGLADATDAYLVGGMLIQPEDAAGVGYDASPTATIVSQPIGTVGASAEWVAMCDGCFHDPRAAYPNAGPSLGMGRLTLTRTDRWLDPDTGGSPSMGFERAVPMDPDEPGDEAHLLAAGHGFEVVVEATSGTFVASAGGGRFEDHGVSSGPMRIPVTPRVPSDSGEAFERTLLFVSPDGLATVRRLVGTFAGASPDLTVSASVERFELQARVAGRTSPGSSVTIDGLPVATTADGRFGVAVDAPIWPRDVIVVARDPFGGEKVSRLDVVGFVDYRSLAWVPIAGLLTVVAAATLFVRIPSVRGHERRPATLEGTLEEIDGDVR